MTLQDVTHRGKRRNFKRAVEQDDASNVSAVLPSQVIDAGELLDLLDDLVEQGGNLTIGRVKQGGAITVRVYLGKPSNPAYLSHSAAWKEWVASLDD